MKQKIGDEILDVDDEYSYKDFTGRDLSNKDLSNRVVYNSCFSQEQPDTEIFAPDTVNTTFYHCNLSNVLIPKGVTTIDCRLTRFKAQNDRRDWEVDESDQPVKVLNEKYWIQQGFSVDPADIPAQKLTSLKDIKKVEK